MPCPALLSPAGNPARSGGTPMMRTSAWPLPASAARPGRPAGASNQLAGRLLHPGLPFHEAIAQLQATAPGRRRPHRVAWSSSRAQPPGNCNRQVRQGVAGWRRSRSMARWLGPPGSPSPARTGRCRKCQWAARCPQPRPPRTRRTRAVDVQHLEHHVEPGPAEVDPGLQQWRGDRLDRASAKLPCRWFAVEAWCSGGEEASEGEIVPDLPCPSGGRA